MAKQWSIDFFECRESVFSKSEELAKASEEIFGGIGMPLNRVHQSSDSTRFCIYYLFDSGEVRLFGSADSACIFLDIFSIDTTPKISSIINQLKTLFQSAYYIMMEMNRGKRFNDRENRRSI